MSKCRTGLKLSAIWDKILYVRRLCARIVPHHKQINNNSFNRFETSKNQFGIRF